MFSIKYKIPLDKLAIANYNMHQLAGANQRLQEEKTMMPLNLADIGQPQIIKRLGGTPEIKKHLEDLGFIVGGEVSVVSSLGGNLIVKVRESRVAVNKEQAMKIMV